MRKGGKSLVQRFKEFLINLTIMTLKSAIHAGCSRLELKRRFISSYQDALIFNLKTSPPLAKLGAHVGAIGLAAKL